MCCQHVRIAVTLSFARMEWSKLLLANTRQEDQFYSVLTNLMEFSWMGVHEDKELMRMALKLVLFLMLNGSTDQRQQIFYTEAKSVVHKKICLILEEDVKLVKSPQECAILEYLSKNESQLIDLSVKTADDWNVQPAVDNNAMTISTEFVNLEGHVQVLEQLHLCQDDSKFSEDMKISTETVNFIVRNLLLSRSMFVNGRINFELCAGLVIELSAIPTPQLNSILGNLARRNLIINQYVDQISARENEKLERLSMKTRVIDQMLVSIPFIRVEYKLAFQYLFNVVFNGVLPARSRVFKEIISGVMVGMESLSDDLQEPGLENDGMFGMLSAIYLVNNMVFEANHGSPMSNQDIVNVFHGRKHPHHAALWSRPVLVRRRDMDPDGLIAFSGLYPTSARNNFQTKIYSCYKCRRFQGSRVKFALHRKHCI